MEYSTSSITAVSEDGLARNPSPLCDKESNKGSNILNIRQSTLQRLTFVKGHSIIGLLRIEESYRTRYC
jgi:hypothetical protein